MRHANTAVPLARSRAATGRTAQLADRAVRVAISPLTPKDLELDRDARAVWCAMLDGFDIQATFGTTPVYHRIAKLFKSNMRYCPLVAIAELLIWFANRGLTESRARLVWVWLDELLSSIYAGRAHPSLDELDLEETEAENLENTLSWRRRVHQQSGRAVTREEYEAEALANEREAAISLTRARELRRRARLLVFTSMTTSNGALA